MCKFVFSVHARDDYRMYQFLYLKVTKNVVPTNFTMMLHISASTAPIRVKQKPLYSKLNAESDKYYYNSLSKSLENPPESLQ